MIFVFFFKQITISGSLQIRRSATLKIFTVRQWRAFIRRSQTTVNRKARRHRHVREHLQRVVVRARVGPQAAQVVAAQAQQAAARRQPRHRRLRVLPPRRQRFAHLRELLRTAVQPVRYAVPTGRDNHRTLSTTPMLPS